MKKIITIAAVASLLAVLLALFVHAGPTGTPYVDVSPDAWYADEVLFVRERSIMLGTSDTTFSPEDRLTRAMYVTLIYRLHGATDKYASGFSDVPADTWYTDPVGWAQKAGIVNGYGDGTFGPDREITRQELAAMTARYLKYAWVTLPDENEAPRSFLDSEKIEPWAADSFEEMRRIGLLRGDPQGRANPESTATRAETATMTARLVRALDEYDPSPSIGGKEIDSISFYCDFMTDAERDENVRVLGEKTGVPVAVSETPDGAAVRVTEDTSLPRLAYRLTEKDGVLTLAIPTEFAADQASVILDGVLSARKVLTVPVEYEENGSFTIPDIEHVKGDVEFFGETDKPPLTYRVGEDVTFRITLLRNGRLVRAPKLFWDYSLDNGKRKVGTEDGSTGQIIITLPGCSVPGCGMLTVKAVNVKGIDLTTYGEAIFTGGVVFNFEEISIAVPEPDDFDEFWAGQLARLDAAPPEILEEFPAWREDDVFNYYSFKISTCDDPAYILVTVPKNAEPGSLEVYVQYYGYGFGTADYVTRGNCICVSVNSHSKENLREGAYYDQVRAELTGFGFEDVAREDYYLLGMILRDVQAIRFATTYFGDLWNGVDVTVSGGSMGGFRTCAAAALCPLVTHADTSITWMCDLGGSTVKRSYGWIPDYTEAHAYFDSVSFAERITCPTSVYAGLGDWTCVPSGVIAMYNALKGEKTATFAQNADHGGRGGPHSYTYVVTGDEVPTGTSVPIVDTGVASSPAS